MMDGAIGFAALAFVVILIHKTMGFAMLRPCSDDGRRDRFASLPLVVFLMYKTVGFVSWYSQRLGHDFYNRLVGKAFGL